MHELLEAQDQWREFAACRQIDDKSFFFDETRAPVAKQFCRTNCPVRYDCLEYAYRTGCEYGVFGGFDEADRARLLKNYGTQGLAALIEQRRLTVS